MCSLSFLLILPTVYIVYAAHKCVTRLFILCESNACDERHIAQARNAMLRPSAAAFFISSHAMSRFK